MFNVGKRINTLKYIESITFYYCYYSIKRSSYKYDASKDGQLSE